MDPKSAADYVKSHGRYGDTELLHVNKYELEALHNSGIPLTINPDTGQPEAFLQFLLPLLGTIGGGAAAGALGVGGLGALGLGALGTAAGSWLGGANFKEGLLSGLLSFGLGSLMDGGLGKIFGKGKDVANPGVDVALQDGFVAQTGKLPDVLAKYGEYGLPNTATGNAVGNIMYGPGGPLNPVANIGTSVVGPSSLGGQAFAGNALSGAYGAAPAAAPSKFLGSSTLGKVFKPTYNVAGPAHAIASGIGAYMLDKPNNTYGSDDEFAEEAKRQRATAEANVARGPLDVSVGYSPYGKGEYDWFSARDPITGRPIYQGYATGGPVANPYSALQYSNLTGLPGLTGISPINLPGISTTPYTPTSYSPPTSTYTPPSYTPPTTIAPYGSSLSNLANISLGGVGAGIPGGIASINLSGIQQYLAGLNNPTGTNQTGAPAPAPVNTGPAVESQDFLYNLFTKDYDQPSRGNPREYAEGGPVGGGIGAARTGGKGTQIGSPEWEESMRSRGKGTPEPAEPSTLAGRHRMYSSIADRWNNRHRHRFGDQTPEWIGTLMEPIDTWQSDFASKAQDAVKEQARLAMENAVDNMNAPSRRGWMGNSSRGWRDDDDMGFAEGGMIPMGSDRTPPIGMEPQPMVPSDTAQLANSIRTEAAMALIGQHPDPEAALMRFVQLFGPEALDQLQQEVQAQQEGRLISGPGAGQDDAIPAMVDGAGPAALSSGEYVVPADVVSGIGDGSSEAGATELENMVERVRQQKTGSSDMPSPGGAKAIPR